MSNTTKSNTSVKVLSDTREEELLSIFRTLHGKVLVALQECDIKPLFSDNFGKCGADDLKSLHQQSRALINTKRQMKWEERISGIRAGIASVCEPYFAKRAKAHTTFLTMSDEDREGMTFNFNVSVPVSEIVGCWPANTDMSLIRKDLNDLGYVVFEKEKVAYIKATYTPKVEKAEEKAPESGEQTKAA